MSLQLRRSHIDGYRNDDTSYGFHQWSKIRQSIKGTENIFFYMTYSTYEDCTHEHRNISEGKQLLIMGTVNAICDLFIFK